MYIIFKSKDFSSISEALGGGYASSGDLNSGYDNGGDIVGGVALCGIRTN